MATDRERLIERFIELLEGMYVGLCSSPSNEWWELELTMPQLKALALLHLGTHRMGDVAAHLGTSLSSATSMVDRLVDKGLVDRGPDPNDRRVVVCELTAHGQEEMERFWRIERMRTVELTNELTTEELGVLVPAMELFYRVGQRVQERLAGPLGAPGAQGQPTRDREDS